jgi:methylisocitrate lyase
LPTIIDADTGFGEPMNAARTVVEFEALGLAGCHIEDQLAPKRCGHVGHKTLVPTDAMVARIKAAADARRDPNFLLIARTDARAAEGLGGAIARARAYADAGADVIFPEALESAREFEAFRSATDSPLLANMTEFGKSPLLDARELEDLGYDIVIYPVTGWRLAMKAVEEGFATLHDEGSQRSLLPAMQTRARLYELAVSPGYRDRTSRPDVHIETSAARAGRHAGSRCGARRARRRAHASARSHSCYSSCSAEPDADGAGHRRVRLPIGTRECR